ncbi:pantoate--beta-alanine ligase [Candidatus Bathyarchaeota archaeon]|nr:pantoate--beta-alanine ligase [Candidatus Bathyarchaeota archaeon]
MIGRSAQEVIGHSLENLFPPKLVESSLELIKKTLAGERDAAKVIAGIRAAIDAEPLVRVDYVEAVDPVNLEPVAEIRGDVLIALAVFVGSTRLIDNIRIRV